MRSTRRGRPRTRMLRSATGTCRACVCRQDTPPPTTPRHPKTRHWVPLTLPVATARNGGGHRLADAEALAKLRSRAQLRQRRGERVLDETELITVPIVFHVVHTGESVGVGTNIADEQIMEGLAQLNNFFSGDSSVFENASPQYSQPVDTGIRFALAVRDEDRII